MSPQWGALSIQEGKSKGDVPNVNLDKGRSKDKVKSRRKPFHRLMPKIVTRTTAEAPVCETKQRQLEYVLAMG
jgi:hypothetical protein